MKIRIRTDHGRVSVCVYDYINAMQYAMLCCHKSLLLNWTLKPQRPVELKLTDWWETAISQAINVHVQCTNKFCQLIDSLKAVCYIYHIPLLKMCLSVFFDWNGWPFVEVISHRRWPSFTDPCHMNRTIKKTPIRSIIVCLQRMPYSILFIQFYEMWKGNNWILDWLYTNA